MILVPTMGRRPKLLLSRMRMFKGGAYSSSLGRYCMGGEGEMGGEEERRGDGETGGEGERGGEGKGEERGKGENTKCTFLCSGHEFEGFIVTLRILHTYAAKHGPTHITIWLSY